MRGNCELRRNYKFSVVFGNSVSSNCDFQVWSIFSPANFGGISLKFPKDFSELEKNMDKSYHFPSWLWKGKSFLT